MSMYMMMRRMSQDPEVAQHQLSQGVVCRVLRFAKPYQRIDRRVRRAVVVDVSSGRHAAAAVQGDHRRGRACRAIGSW